MVKVANPPGFVARYLWVNIGVIVLVILAILALLWSRASRRRRVDVRGLRAIIRIDGGQVGAELGTPGRWSEAFRFVIREEGEPTARLDYPQPGEPTYSARRRQAGQIRVVAPGGEQYDISIGGPGEPLPSGLWLAFRDTRQGPRSRSSAGRNAAGRGGPSDRAPRASPVDSRHGAIPLTASPDDWL